MAIRIDGPSIWSGGWHPIVAGAVVGLITGLLGLLTTTVVFSTSVGGLAGAVGCGVTVAYLSEEGLHKVVVHAVIADVVSSIGFFVLVLLAYLTMVWVHEGLALISAIWFSMTYLVFGGLIVAVPVGAISLGLTGVSATVTSLFRQRMAEPSVRG